MESSSPPGSILMARSSTGSDSDHVVIQVLADEVTIQLVADRARIAIDTTLVSDHHEDEMEEEQKRVRKAVLKITGSIIAIVSGVVGFVDDPSKMGFPMILHRSYPCLKLAIKGCFLAVMVCFCLSLALLMLSEVTKQPPVSISTAKKLMLLVFTLVQIVAAMKTASVLMEL